MQQLSYPSHPISLQQLAKLWLSITSRRTPPISEGASPQNTPQNTSLRGRNGDFQWRAHHDAKPAGSRTVAHRAYAEEGRKPLADFLDEEIGSVAKELEPALQAMLADQFNQISLNLQKARQVQQEFFPQSMPTITGLEMHAALRSQQISLGPQTNCN